MTRLLRASVIVSVCAAALAFGALSGCSSSGGSSKLSKADFITQADAACASTLAELKAAKQPTSLTDYADIINYDNVVLAAFPKYHATVTALVDRSPDTAALHKNWIDPEQVDYLANKPYVEKFNAAARAKNSSQITAVANQVSALPDHSSAEATYLTGYGLPTCSAVANFGNG